MKRLAILSAVAGVALLTPTLGAQPTPVGETSFDQVCVPVSCDGVASGVACGSTTEEIVDAAIELCDNVNQQ